MSWSLLYVSQDDINGEISRSKSMDDANISLTPKHNLKAVSQFQSSFNYFVKYFLFIRKKARLHMSVPMTLLKDVISFCLRKTKFAVASKTV